MEPLIIEVQNSTITTEKGAQYIMGAIEDSQNITQRDREQMFHNTENNLQKEGK